MLVTGLLHLTSVAGATPGGSWRRYFAVGSIGWLLGFALISCSAEPEPEPELLRLLELDKSLIEVSRPLTATPAEECLVLLETFQEKAQASWFAADSLRPRREPMQLTALKGDDGLAIPEEGLAVFLSAEPQAAYRIQVTVSQVSDSPSLRILPLNSDPGPRSAMTPERAAILAREALEQRYEEPALASTQRGSTAGEVSLQHVANPRAGRHGLLLVLQNEPGKSGRVQEFSVRRLAALEYLQLQGDKQGEDFEEPLRQKVMMGRSLRDCMLLPAPATWTVPVDLRGPGPALQLALAVQGSSRQDSLLFELQVGEERVLERTLTVEKDWTCGFVPIEVDLQPFAGAQVELSFRTQVLRGSGAVGLVAHPMVLFRQPSPRPNLVLISLDTLRADHLSCYGYSLPTSPRLDQLAADGVRFERVLSPSSWTRPTHFTLFSGQSPQVHGIRGHGFRRVLPARTPLLAVALREAGYRTAAFTGGGNVDPQFGFEIGFDRYDTLDPARPVPSSAGKKTPLEQALQWLERSNEAPFFLFLHTYLIHNYEPLPEYLQKLRPECERGTLEDPLRLVHSLRAGGDPADVEHLRHLYDAAIAQVDERVVGTLLDALVTLGLKDNTIVSVVSDHGEEFLEHGGVGHGHSLFGEVLRVPWILWAPGIEAEVFPDWVSLQDVAPTLRQLLGIGQDERAHGIPLLPLGLSTPARPPLLLEVFGVEHGLFEAPYKLLSATTAEAPWRLFHQQQDPLERTDSSDSEPRVLARLKERWRQRVEEEQARGEALAPMDEQGELDAQLRQELEALGYLQD